MKKIRSLTALAVASLFLAGFAFAADKKEAAKSEAKVAGCCAKATKEGKTCSHGCCVEAAKGGQNCAKCGGSGALEAKK